MDVVAAGLTPDTSEAPCVESYHMDIQVTAHIRQVLDKVQPSHIICTAGINEPQPFVSHDWSLFADRAWLVNAMGPLRLLHEWLSHRPQGQFIVVSSNSASIPRRQSAPYCMSKAALSMGIRCVARELGGTPLVYGYEFGLLAGTPMTVQSGADFAGPLHRMVGVRGEGLSVSTAARHITDNLMHGSEELNGCLLRMDAGEQ